MCGTGTLTPFQSEFQCNTSSVRPCMNRHGQREHFDCSLYSAAICHSSIYPIGFGHSGIIIASSNTTLWESETSSYRANSIHHTCPVSAEYNINSLVLHNRFKPSNLILLFASSPLRQKNIICARLILHRPRGWRQQLYRSPISLYLPIAR